jgi:outer membrane protein TolC
MVESALRSPKRMARTTAAHRRSRIALLLLLVCQGDAFAQTSSPAGTPGAPPTLPPPPAVDDPMLAPPPPPKRVLQSWSEAVAFLRTRSTDLRIALDQVLMAEAQSRVALAQYLPQIAGSGYYAHQLVTHTAASPLPVLVGSGLVVGEVSTLTVPISNIWGGTLQAQQSILDVSALDRIGIDRLGEDASRLSVDDKKRALVLALGNQIVAVVTAERGAEINRIGLRVALEQRELVMRQQNLGGATLIDLVRADENAADARATLVTGDESLREAREALGLALGIAEETGVAPGVNVNGVAEEARSSCRPVQALDDRPDVAAARVELEVAKRNLRNVWYGFLPTVTAASTVSATSVVPVGYPNPTWSIQGLLSIPIWDGGARYGALRLTRATEDVAAQQLEALRRQGTLQVELAQRQLVVAELSDKVAREQRDLAAKNERLTQIAYLAGQGTSFELVTASEAHRQAELNLAFRDFEIVKSRLFAMLALSTCPW